MLDCSIVILRQSIVGNTRYKYRELSLADVAHSLVSVTACSNQPFLQVDRGDKEVPLCGQADVHFSKSSANNL